MFTVAACASSTDTPGTNGDADPSRAELRIDIFDGEKSPNGETVESDPTASYTLTCAPVGGDHPNPADACAFLAQAGAADQDPFAAVPENTPCTRIYGGPQTATVTGRWQGRQVDARFNLQGGCEIDRWNTAQPLLGDPTAGFSSSPPATPQS